MNLRLFQNDSQAIVSIYEQCREYDQIDPLSTVETIPTIETIDTYLRENHCEPRKDILIAENDKKVIGYARVSRWTEEDGTWLFLLSGMLVPEWRRKGVGTELLEWAETHVQELADIYNVRGKAVYGANAATTEKEKTQLLLTHAYKEVWRSAEFAFDDFEHLSEPVIPQRFILKPVISNQFRAIWEINKEIYAGTWGNVPPSEEDFQDFIDSPNLDPELWTAAWYGDEIAGFVISEISNGRGEILEVSVRNQFRRKGLAKALLITNLLRLKEKGVTTVRLHTDAENKSGARGLYEQVGFRYLKDMVRYRKVVKIYNM